MTSAPPSNLDKYKKELLDLIRRGGDLHNAVQYENSPEEFDRVARENLKEGADGFLKGLPSFKGTYQVWYSEAKALIKQLLPDRLSDFTRLYERPKSRRDITYENYTIEDCLHGLRVTRGAYETKVVGPDAAYNLFAQQLAILTSATARFSSSLFDIRPLVQADLFDSELVAAGELARHKYTRAAGALAGVVLERHLQQTCQTHSLTIRKQNPGISDLNEILKSANVIDVPQWRFIQHLADIRNLCDHSKKAEPTVEQVDDLIGGTSKVIKTVF